MGTPRQWWVRLRETTRLRTRAWLWLRMATGGVRIGSFERAQDYARRAIEAYESLGEVGRGAAAYAALAAASLHLGHLEESRTAAEKSLASGFCTILAGGRDIFQILALSLYLAGAYAKAIESFERSCLLAIDRGSLKAILTSLFGLIDCYVQLRQPEKAEEFVDRALVLARRLGDLRGVAAGLMARASVRFAAWDSEGVKNALDEALSAAERSGDQQLRATVQLHAATLRAAFEGSTVAGSTPAPQIDEMPAYVRLPFVVQAARAAMATGDVAGARSLLEELVAAVSREGSAKETRAALLELAHLWHVSGNSAEVERTLLQAVALNEQIRFAQGDEDDMKISLAQGFLVEYDLLQEALVAQGKIVEALEYAERSRGRAFSDLIEHPAPEQVESPIRIGEIRDYATANRATIIEYSLLPKWPGMIKVLPSAAELLAYVVKPEGDVQLRRLSLEIEQVDRWGEARLDPPSEVTSSSPRDLSLPGEATVEALDLEKHSAWLIEPIGDLLPEDPREAVLFVPDSAFLSVPFAALHSPRGGALVEHHPILIAPSIQVVSRLHRRTLTKRQTARGALVVGDPDGSLPHATQEARQIASMLQVEPFLGAAATKERVLAEMPRRRILHFATHGRFDPEAREGMPGAIRLSPTQEGDGWLTAENVRALTLDADLVVLSSCWTGGGRETADGMVGFSRALLAAGAATVLAAVSPVPDDLTEILMTTFYSHLAAGDAAEALRQGMLAAIRFNAASATHVWASFILMGERFVPTPLAQGASDV
jgi:CHAT domain-containing protein